MDLNKVYNENCLDTMRRMPDGTVDLSVTSPPYDKLRVYNGFSFDFLNIAKELYRIMKEGGVVVWIVSDQAKGSESGTSFRQALHFMDLGFWLYDTMIWEKESFSTPQGSVRYYQVFEYMFIISKGKPKTFNMIRDRPNIHVGRTIHGTETQKDGSAKPCSGKGKVLKHLGGRYNVWRINSDREGLGHPAPFPEQLAADHIHSWSNEGDLVYDPFGGSGTTGKMAQIMGRNWILSEISEEYTDIANRRILPHIQQQNLFRA
jgi:DNA modification methylase